MKPNFALNITDSTISLLHRTSRGWMEVGSADFDSPDLEEALGYLRSSALGLSPHGITTKLVLPASQVLYTEVEAPGPDRAAREVQIRAALEGRTPYAVDDLVFDWRGTGPVVKVAVVARETLAEAEGFADTHRFNPVSFVTIPAEGQFTGEPWFGTTSVVATVLPKGQKVTRDQDPVQVIQRDAAKAAPKSDTPPVTEKADDGDKATKPADTDTAEKAKAERLDDAAALTEAELKRQREVEVQREEEARKADDAQREADERSAAEAQRAAQAQREAIAEDAARQKAEAARAEMELRAQELAQAEAKRLVEEAEKTKAAYQERENSRAAMIEAERQRASSPQAAAEVAKAAFEGVSDPVIADGPDTVPAPPAFASRRRDDSGTPPTLGSARSDGAASAEKPKVSGPAAPTVTSISARAAGPAAPTVVVKAAVSSAAPASGVAPKPLNGTPTFAQGGKPTLTPAPNKPAPVTLEKADVTAPGTATRIPGKAAALSRFKSKVSADPVQATSARSDATLGKMGAKLAKDRGKPRFLGLILTLVLMAILAGVAAWSSIYLSRNSTTSDPIQQAESTPTDPAATADVQAADAEPEAVSDAEAVANAEAELPPVADLSTTAQPEQAAPAGPGPEVTADGTTAQTAAPGRGPQDEIMLAGTDGQPPAFDAVALPRPQARPDGAPNAAMPPPPFGTEYEFEADGQIKATAKGVIMPDGFWLIAARPPVIPPARPASISGPAAAATPPPDNPAASAAAASTAGLGQEGGSGPSSAFTQDATVESRRPKTRPAALDAAPATPPATEDDAALPTTDPALQRLATLRPKLRPQSVVAAAETQQAVAAAQQAVEAASLTATAAAAAKADQGSSMTVALSPRPAPRPRDFSRAVAAAVSAATRESTRRQTATAAAAAAAAPRGKIEPEEEDEPEVKTAAAPRIPTRANVASQATFKNAINLSKTNLIGVYGTDNKRYALIRTSNGRYTKVRVGDKVDGGIVAAITRNELRYKKGNKMLSLAMPNG